MLRGNTQDSKSKFEQDLVELKLKVGDARSKYFQMEEQAMAFFTSKKIGGKNGQNFSGDADDKFIRFQNIDNMEQLRKGDQALG